MEEEVRRGKKMAGGRGASEMAEMEGAPASEMVGMEGLRRPDAVAAPPRAAEEGAPWGRKGAAAVRA